MRVGRASQGARVVAAWVVRYVPYNSRGFLTHLIQAINQPFKTISEIAFRGHCFGMHIFFSSDTHVCIKIKSTQLEYDLTLYMLMVTHTSVRNMYLVIVFESLGVSRHAGSFVRASDVHPSPEPTPLLDPESQFRK